MATRKPKPPQPLVLPPDVRLMNGTASALLILAAFAFAGLALAWALRSPAFTLRAIRIEGDVAHNSAVTVRAAALPQLTGNFFSIDLAQARTAFETVPWVRRAVVRKVWPDRLVVRLEEHLPAAWWHTDEGDDKLVNVQGEVFEANPGDVEDDGLPVLQGPEGSAAATLALYRSLGPEIARLGSRIDVLELSARGSWRAELDSGAVIELGRGNEAQVAERTRGFVDSVGVLTQRYQRPIESADLRHADGYALRLRGVATGVPEPHLPASKR
jgi:cell division protein FtsQ